MRGINSKNMKEKNDKKRNICNVYILKSVRSNMTTNISAHNNSYCLLLVVMLYYYFYGWLFFLVCFLLLLFLLRPRLELTHLLQDVTHASRTLDSNIEVWR